MSDHRPLIRSILAEHGRLSTDVATIGDADSLYEAGLTSHASVNVMLAIEDAIGAEFPERLLKRATFESISTLVGALAELDGA